MRRFLPWSERGPAAEWTRRDGGGAPTTARRRSGTVVPGGGRLASTGGRSSREGGLPGLIRDGRQAGRGREGKGTAPPAQWRRRRRRRGGKGDRERMRWSPRRARPRTAARRRGRACPSPTRRGSAPTTTSYPLRSPLTGCSAPPLSPVVCAATMCPTVRPPVPFV